MNRKATRIAIVLISLGAAGLAIREGLPLLIDHFVDRNAIRQSVEDGLRKSSGVNFQIHEVTLEPTFFHGFSVHLHDSRIADLQHHPLGSVGRVTIEIRYLPLLTRQTPEIARVRIRNANIPIGAYNLFQSLHIRIQPPKKTGFLNPPEMRNTEIRLSDCRIEDSRLDPEVRKALFSPKDKAPRFRLTIGRLSIKHLQSEKPLAISADGELAFLPGPLFRPLSGLLHKPDPRSLVQYHLNIRLPMETAKPGEPPVMGSARAAEKPAVPPAITQQDEPIPVQPGKAPSPTQIVRDLQRLEVRLEGSTLDLKLKYRKHRHDSEGLLNASHVDLTAAQMETRQIADTFGLPALRGPMPVRPAGTVSVENARFKLGFPVGGHPRLNALEGFARLDDASLSLAASPAGLSQPVLHRATGRFRFHNSRVAIEKMDFRVAEMPLSLQGNYDLAAQKINLALSGQNLPIASLKSILVRSGTSGPVASGWMVGGAADINAHLAGPVRSPAYNGVAVLRNGLFQDRTQGLDLRKAHVRVQFEGTPSLLRYNGRVKAEEGQLDRRKQGIVIRRFNGDMAFTGNVRFQSGGKPALPVCRGWIHFRDGQYRHPKTHLLVDQIRGGLNLTGDRIFLQDFRGLLGGAAFMANGNITPDYQKPERSLYRFRVWSRQIGLKRLYGDMMAGVKASPHTPLSQLRPESGTADLDLTVETGLRFRGRLDAHRLAVRPPHASMPLQAQLLSVRFSDQSAQLLPARLNYGQAELRVAGQFHPTGQYRVQAQSGEIPVAFLRDEAEVIQALSGVQLPQIWNTAGAFAFRGDFGSTARTARVDFHDAGLSWKNADFPIYNMRGGLTFRQSGKGQPDITTDNLMFHYGDSAIALRVNHHSGLNADVAGTLSPLTMNHFLVSRQSNATPYAPVPFRIHVSGGAPGGWHGPQSLAHSHLKADVFLDLNQNLKETEFVPADEGTQQRIQEKRASDAPDNPQSHSENNPKILAPTASPAKGPVYSGERPKGPLNAPHPMALGPVYPAAHPPQGAASPSGKPDIIPPEPLPPKIPPMPQAAPSSTAMENAQLAKPAAGAPSASEKEKAGMPAALPSPAGLSSGGTRRGEGAGVTPGGIPPGEMSKKETREGSREASEILPQNDQTAWLRAGLLWKGSEFQVENAILHLFDAGDILASGHWSFPAKRGQKPVYRLHVSTSPELNLGRLASEGRRNGFFRDAKGTVGMDINLLTQGEDKTIHGWLKTDQVAMPYLTIRQLTGQAMLEGVSGVAEIERFEIPGVSAGLSARLENVFESPVSLENVAIRGRQISIAGLTDFGDEVIKPILVDQVSHSFMRPWQQGDPTLPFQFRNADLRVDEVIYQNIILSNLTGRFSVYANSFFELSGARLDAAGGVAHGYLSMSPNDNNFTTLELNMENVKANALTKALLNTTNQIFGDVHGTVRFSTFGQTDDQMQRNANGTVSMKVTNGRLPAIARVETLLTTANVLRGGILGLNLNNLFRSLTFYDTNYFAALSGDMLIGNEVLYTRNLISDGVNLDLHIQGNLRMDNGRANMLVTGRMSQDVAGRLGFLGSLSLNRLLKHVPAIGTLGKNQPGLLGYLPGVGWVPGFGGPAGDINWFQVRLYGMLDEPSAIRSFRWIRPPAGLGVRSAPGQPVAKPIPLPPPPRKRH